MLCKVVLCEVSRCKCDALTFSSQHFKGSMRAQSLFNCPKLFCDRLWQCQLFDFQIVFHYYSLSSSLTIHSSFSSITLVLSTLTWFGLGRLIQVKYKNWDYASWVWQRSVQRLNLTNRGFSKIMFNQTVMRQSLVSGDFGRMTVNPLLLLLSVLIMIRYESEYFCLLSLKNTVSPESFFFSGVSKPF